MLCYCQLALLKYQSNAYYPFKSHSWTLEVFMLYLPHQILEELST